MAANIAVWDSHAWFIRELELEPGAPLMHHVCRDCGRNFVVEFRTGELYAVHVGALRFDRLSADTTARWLADFCLGQWLISDQADLTTRARGGGRTDGK